MPTTKSNMLQFKIEQCLEKYMNKKIYFNTHIKLRLRNDDLENMK